MPSPISWRPFVKFHWRVIWFLLVDAGRHRAWPKESATRRDRGWPETERRPCRQARRYAADSTRLQQRRHRSRSRSAADRSEEHTSELQSLMRISYAVFCLKKKKQTQQTNYNVPTDSTDSTTKTS